MRKNAPMIRRLLAAAALVTLALMGTVAVLVALNAPPAVPALTATTIAGSPKPYVVKLHAQWCPYCMFTKDEWTQIEQRYGSRVHLLVLDFTSEAATARSRAEAERLNLGQFFDEYAGATGGVVVLDGRTLEVTAEIFGNRPFEDYRSAIDAALAKAPTVL
jgi:thiol-disulfide isomerase/thioredoxin